MKKGFTLIELLAVIVILAIIALIATPMILGVIESAKKGSAENSAIGYIQAIDSTNIQNMVENGGFSKRRDGTYYLDTIGNVNYKGKGPESICVKIKNGEVASGSFQFGSYVVDYKDGKAAVNPDKKKQLVELFILVFMMES